MGIARFSINRQALAGVVLILAALLTFNVVAYWVYRPIRTFNEGKPPASDKQLLFLVEKSGNQIYLMGITHQGSLDLYPLRPEIKSVFSSCDFLAESLQADLDQSRAPSFQALYWTRRNENMLASCSVTQVE